MHRSTKRSLARMLTVAFVVVVVISLLSVAAQWEIEAQEMSERAYCERVQSGIIRDWNDDINCGE